MAGLRQKIVRINHEAGLFLGMFAFEPLTRTGLHQHQATAISYFLDGSLHDYSGVASMGMAGINLRGATHDAILAYPGFAIASVLFADRIERKWQVALSSLGMAVCGVIFSLQTGPAALIVLGLIQTSLLTWLSFSYHNYMAEIYPTRIRARAVGFAYSWSRFSTIFTGFFIALFF